jgi:hypothetical protein
MLLIYAIFICSGSYSCGVPNVAPHGRSFCSCHAFELDSKKQTWIGMAREFLSITKNIDTYFTSREGDHTVQMPQRKIR